MPALQITALGTFPKEVCQFVYLGFILFKLIVKKLSKFTGHLLFGIQGNVKGTIAGIPTNFFILKLPI
jgi:hypothetical protein